MSTSDPLLTPSRLKATLPRHLADWTLPPGWSWGHDSVWGDRRHYQEVVDALDRSLSLVSAPEPEHAEWLRNEARALGHRNHPSVPTTYHYWASYEQSRRGPGYLRRWIAGETVAQRVTRLGPESVPTVLQVLREAGSTLAYLHDAGALHRALSAHNVWLTPGGRLWLLGWEWVLPVDQLPAGMRPDPARTPQAPEWSDGRWSPTPQSDQWQLAAMVFTALTGETPPAQEPPPVALLRPDCPVGLARALEQALHPDPARRFPSVRAFLREVDRLVSMRVTMVEPAADELPIAEDTPETRLRWATADDYEILAPLGSGTFGSVWRARDLTLAREVAIKVLHPHIAKDDVAVSRFRREARLAAQLAHPAIVPIYDSDERGGVVWYTMELAEGGSVASLIARRGPRDFEEIAAPVDGVLDGLMAAHASGIIHRDLKPENILIDRYRRWRIGDFGIAQAWGEDASTSSTGTPAFAAPEQLLGESQGPATDCYALAGIVYFALTGRPPFGDAGAEQVLAQQLGAKLAERLQLAAFPAPLEEFLSRGLAPDVNDRYADAAELRQAWRQVVRAMRRTDDPRPWWRRVFEGPMEEEDAAFDDTLLAGEGRPTG
jgi:eukaryotic-like serine/threonine-protein kinase